MYFKILWIMIFCYRNRKIPNAAFQAITGVGHCQSSWDQLPSSELIDEWQAENRRILGAVRTKSMLGGSKRQQIQRKKSDKNVLGVGKHFSHGYYSQNWWEAWSSGAWDWEMILAVLPKKVWARVFPRTWIKGYCDFVSQSYLVIYIGL